MQEEFTLEEIMEALKNCSKSSREELADELEEYLLS